MKNSNKTNEQLLKEINLLKVKITELKKYKTERKQVEDTLKKNKEKLDKINRLYAFLSQVNQTIVRERDKQQLFQEICSIAIEFGKFRLSWIGFLDEETKLVEPVAFSGEGSDYLQHMKISLNDNSTCKGPTGRAFIEGKSIVFNDLENNPDFAPWREQALKKGYLSSGAFPIRLNNIVIGTLSVYAVETHFFDEQEIKLLEEATMDISFALEKFEEEENRRQVEKALSEANIIINRSPAVAFLLKNEENWPVEFVSENVEKLSGYSAQEFLEGKISYSEIIHSSDLEKVNGEVNSNSKKEGLQTFAHESYRIITKNGDIKWVDDITYIRRDSKGIITHYEGIVYDITERKIIEEELQERRDENTKLAVMAKERGELQDWINTFDTFVGKYDKNGFGLIFNKAPIVAGGVAIEDVAGKYFPDTKWWSHSEIERKRVIDCFEKAKDGLSSRIETNFRSADGTPVPIIFNCQPVMDDEEKVKYITAEGKTIIKETQLRNELQEAKEELETRVRERTSELVEANKIINRSPAVAFLWKNEEGWPAEFVSENVKKLFGYSVQEFLERKILYSEVIHSNDLKRVTEEVVSNSKKEGLKTFAHEPYRIITKNGDIKWIDDITYIRRDSRGIITHYEGIIYDVTERKQAEERIARFARIFEDSLNEIYLFEADTLKFTQVNSAAQNNLGYTMEELQKLTPLDLKPEFTHDSFAKLIAPLYNGEKEKIVFETVHKRKDQSRYEVEIHFQLLKYEQKALIAAIVLDITERKHAVQRLRESEEKFKAYTNQSTEGITVADMKGNYVFVNPAFCKMSGYSEEELLNMTVFNMKAKNQDHLNFFKNKDAMEGVPMEVKLQRKDKTKYLTEVIGKVITIGNKKFALGTIRDITEHKQAEIALKRSETRLSTLMGNLPGMAYQCKNDEYRTMLFINEACEQITGYMPDQLIYNKEISYNELIHPDDRVFVSKQVEEALNIGEHFELEYRIITTDGNEKWVWERGVQLTSQEYSPKLLEGVIHDITDRKRAEEELKKYHEHLEELVKERTKELEEKNIELDKAMKVFVGRELKIRELQIKIKVLEEKE